MTSRRAQSQEQIRVGERDLLVRDLYRTPAYLFRFLDKRWRFGVDAAARASDAKCTNYLGPDHPLPAHRDALACPVELWSPEGLPAFLNPPFSQQSGGKLLAWMQRAALVGQEMAPVVVVVPATPSTRWFRRALERTANSIEFLQRRVAFDDPSGHPTKRAPGDTCVVTFLPHSKGPAAVRYLDLEQAASERA